MRLLFVVCSKIMCSYRNSSFLWNFYTRLSFISSTYTRLCVDVLQDTVQVTYRQHSAKTNLLNFLRSPHSSSRCENFLPVGELMMLANFWNCFNRTKYFQSTKQGKLLAQLSKYSMYSKESKHPKISTFLLILSSSIFWLYFYNAHK